MSLTLARWNVLPMEEAVRAILPCCGSETWAARLALKRPIQDEASLLAASNVIWGSLEESDWLEAFRSHPRIGERQAEKNASSEFVKWPAQEQRAAASGDEAVKMALRAGNLQYEKKFGRIFIVCATEKSAGEILEILRGRLDNDEVTELRQAGEEQRNIMQLRLKKWLAG